MSSTAYPDALLIGRVEQRQGGPLASLRSRAAQPNCPHGDLPQIRVLDVPLNHQPRRAAFHDSSVPLGEGSVRLTPAPQGFFGAICERPCTSRPPWPARHAEQDPQ